MREKGKEKKLSILIKYSKKWVALKNTIRNCGVHESIAAACCSKNTYVLLQLCEGRGIRGLIGFVSDFCLEIKSREKVWPVGEVK